MSNDFNQLYRAIKKANEIAEKKCDFLLFVLYLMEDKLNGDMTRCEKIAYIEKRIVEKRGDPERLQRMLANLKEYGEVYRPLPNSF